MTVPFRLHRLWPYGIVMASILLAGLVASGVSYHMERSEERHAAQAAFERRATQRHALIREVLGRYEDALHGLSAVFMLDADVSLAEFDHVAGRIATRIAGVQAFEWVPVISHDERARFEASLQRSYAGRGGEFMELDRKGELRRASNRPGVLSDCLCASLAGQRGCARLRFDGRPNRPVP